MANDEMKDFYVSQRQAAQRAAEIVDRRKEFRKKPKRVLERQEKEGHRRGKKSPLLQASIDQRGYCTTCHIRVDWRPFFMVVWVVSSPYPSSNGRVMGRESIKALVMFKTGVETFGPYVEKACRYHAPIKSVRLLDTTNLNVTLSS